MSGIWNAIFSMFGSNRHLCENTMFLIPLFPLVGFLINGVFGKKLSKGTISFVAVFAAFASFMWAAAGVGALNSPDATGPQFRNALHDSYGTWLQIGDFSFNFGLMIDELSSVMILVVTGIGTLIHLYSVGYMGEDKGFSRFMAYLNLFLFAMILLVLGDNLVMLFVGWEGVGLCSYLLIGFWYEESANATAGMKAFVVNRIGDLGFMLGMFILVAVFGTLNFAARPVTVRELGARMTPATHVAEEGEHKGVVVVPRNAGLLDYGDAFRLLSHEKEQAAEHIVVGEKMDPTKSNLELSRTKAWGISLFDGKTVAAVLAFTCMLLFVGAMGKSAQIPLYVWLPDAMAGPTPVSALIHAATMVTAGVYMVSRLHGLFSVSHEALLLVAGIGAATALFSALIGLTQLDIKKVMAYSTVSQLGYMFVGAGVGAFSLAIFHVVTHAFFKALLFLGSGSVIHGMSGEQDMRKMGGLRKLMPITFWTMLMGAMALAGVPFFAGWWSKDNIMAALLARGIAGEGSVYYLLYIMVSIGALCTAFYTFRMIMLTFFGENRASEEVQHHIHESPWVMTLPLIILAILSAGGGCLLHSKFVPEHEGFIPGGPGLYNLLAEHEALHHAHTINLAVTFLAALIGIAGAVFMYKNGKNIPNPELAKTNVAYKLSLNKFYVDEIYNAIIVVPFRIGSELAHWIIELLVIDLFVTGSGYLVSGISGVLRRIQTGLINGYAAGVLAGALFLLFYLLRQP